MAPVRHPTSHDRVDLLGEVGQSAARAQMKPPASNFFSFGGQFVPAHCRAERGEHYLRPLIERWPGPEGLSEEIERDVVMSASPATVTAIHDLGLVRVEFLSDLFHPLADRGSHFERLALAETLS